MAGGDQAIRLKVHVSQFAQGLFVVVHTDKHRAQKRHHQI